MCLVDNSEERGRPKPYHTSMSIVYHIISLLVASFIQLYLGSTLSFLCRSALSRQKHHRLPPQPQAMRREWVTSVRRYRRTGAVVTRRHRERPSGSTDPDGRRRGTEETPLVMTGRQSRGAAATGRSDRTVQGRRNNEHR